jgi:hypothetical protein
MFNLPQLCLSDLTFSTRRLVRLLDEAMQHDDSFGGQRTEENARNPFGAFQSQLEQTVTKGLVCGAPKFWPSTTIRRVSTIYLAANVSGRPRISACTTSL